MAALCGNGDGGGGGGLESMFYRQLKSMRWLCAQVSSFRLTSGAAANELEMLTRTELVRACDLFMKEQVFMRFYGLHQIPYTANHLSSSPTSLARDLGIQCDFDVAHFLHFFRSRITSCATLESPIVASLHQMRNIYSLIANQLLQHSLTDSSTKHICEQLVRAPAAIVFVPLNKSESESGGQQREKQLAGVFRPAADCSWHDPTHLFATYASTLTATTTTTTTCMPNLLAPIYASANDDTLKRFFVHELGVRETPRLADYVALLEHVAMQASVAHSAASYSQALAHVYTLYAVLVDKCVERATGVELRVASDVSKEELLTLLGDKRVVPCVGNKWLRASDTCVLVDGEHELAARFYRHAKLDMIAMPAIMAADRNVVSMDAALDDDAFATYCRAESFHRGLDARVRFLFTHLLPAVHLFTSVLVLDLENITESLRPAPPHVRAICSQLTPWIQVSLILIARILKLFSIIEVN